MEKKRRERVEVAEIIQVGCKLKLKDLFVHRHCRPKKKLLGISENKSKCVTGAGHPRGKSNSSTLSNYCRGIKSASENKGVAINDGAEINWRQLNQENDEKHKFALEILNSNSELFLKLLKDPDSLLVKRIRNTKNLQEAKRETVKLLYENKLAECGVNAIPKRSQKPIHTTRRSLLERIRSQYGCPSTDVEVPSTSNCIVVLKPKQTKQERPNVSSNRATVCESIEERRSLPSVSNLNKRDVEAKMHLSFMLRNAENVEKISDKQEPRTLKSILSSPLSSPEHDFSAASSLEKHRDASVFPQQIYSVCRNFKYACKKKSSLLQSLKVSTSSSIKKHTDEFQNVECGEIIIEPDYSSDGLSCHAFVKNVEVNDTIRSENLNISELPFKQSTLATSAEQSFATTKVRYVNSFSECSIQHLQLENKPFNFPSVVSSSNKSSDYKVETEDCVIEREEHLSPNSVLEALFTEDITGLTSNTSYHEKSHMQPLHPNNKEALLVKEYTRTLLQMFELFPYKLSEKSHSSVELLNTCSLDEHTLFLDFVKDILQEINQCHSEFYPTTSLVRENTLASSLLAKNTIEEFLEEIQWYLVPPAAPRTLDDLAIKDIKNDKTWTDRRLETQEVVFQLTDYLLEELIMHTTFVSQKYQVL